MGQQFWHLTLSIGPEFICRLALSSMLVTLDGIRVDFYTVAEGGYLQRRGLALTLSNNFRRFYVYLLVFRSSQNKNCCLVFSPVVPSLRMTYIRSFECSKIEINIMITITFEQSSSLSQRALSRRGREPESLMCFWILAKL